MPEIVEFAPLNAVHARVGASVKVHAEIKDFFTFEVPGARFSALYKRGHWDGRICLFKNQRLYTGLESRLKAFCDKRGYEFRSQLYSNRENNITDNFISNLGLPEKYSIRDYQLGTFRKAIEQSRGLFLSPTSSGKSLMIYLLTRFHARKTLIIVPTISLVHQMAGDFVDYGVKPTDVYMIISGKEKEPTFVKISLENGKELVLNGNQLVKIINSKVLKRAQDLTQDDEISDEWLQLYREQIL